MELIPILSTIILVATISTFILAVGAYILYKIREGRQTAYKESKPVQLKAEYIVPKDKEEKKIIVEHMSEKEPKKTYTGERFKPVGFPLDAANETEDIPVKSHFNVKDKEEIEVEFPDTKFSRFQGKEKNLHDEEKIQSEIKWR